MIINEITIHRLLKNNKEGLLIKLIKDNVHEWSVKTFEYIMKISKKYGNWRVVCCMLKINIHQKKILSHTLLHYFSNFDSEINLDKIHCMTNFENTSIPTYISDCKNLKIMKYKIDAYLRISHHKYGNRNTDFDMWFDRDIGSNNLIFLTTTPNVNYIPESKFKSLYSHNIQYVNYNRNIKAMIKYIKHLEFIGIKSKIIHFYLAKYDDNLIKKAFYKYGFDTFEILKDCQFYKNYRNQNTTMLKSIITKELQHISSFGLTNILKIFTKDKELKKLIDYFDIDITKYDLYKINCLERKLGYKIY